MVAADIAGLLSVVDWVYRTGWRSRARDQAMAAWIFNAWWEDTHSSCRQSKNRDRAALLKALQEVFADTHDAEGVEHLCTLYTARFEVDIQLRDWTHHM
jgi:hypothetical protein